MSSIPHKTGEKEHGRIERRSIAVRDLPEGILRFRHARQTFRVRRRRLAGATGEAAEETAYGICSVAAGQAGAERLLAWNRGVPAFTTAAILAPCGKQP